MGPSAGGLSGPILPALKSTVLEPRLPSVVGRVHVCVCVSGRDSFKEREKERGECRQQGSWRVSMHSHHEGNIFLLQLQVSIEDSAGMKTTVLYFPLLSLCSTSTCPSISPSLSPVGAPPVVAAAVCLPCALWRRWCGAVLTDRGRGSNCTAKSWLSTSKTLPRGSGWCFTSQPLPYSQGSLPNADLKTLSAQIIDIA